MCTAMPPMFITADLAFAVCNPARHLDAERLHRVADRHGAAGSLAEGRRTSPGKPSPDVFTSRPRKRDSCDRTTASCASSSACQSRSPISAARRVESDDVGEQHRGEYPIVCDLSLVAGEELGDLLE